MPDANNSRMYAGTTIGSPTVDSSIESLAATSLQLQARAKELHGVKAKLEFDLETVQREIDEISDVNANLTAIIDKYTTANSQKNPTAGSIGGLR